MSSFPRFQLIFTLTWLALASRAAAQLDYSVRVDAVQETWSVECELSNPGAADFDFWLARWTAGAYHRADFGRFVGQLTAYGARGELLEVSRPAETHFRIGAKGHATVTLKYEARSISSGILTDGVLDVESNRIRDNYAFLNPVSLLGFVPERLHEPYSVRFELPEAWQTACILQADPSGIYRAPSFYRMEDSPFLFSPTLRSVDLKAGGKGLTVSAHGLGEAAMGDLVNDCLALVEAAAELLGGLPYDHYEFLFGFVPEGDGSGLEHSYSTLILLPAKTKPAVSRGLISHEFFHLWCAERIHVQALEEPDYTQLFQSSTIWVNESITEYLSRLLLVHAGMLDHEEFLAGLSEPSAQMAAMHAAGLVRPGTEASRRATDWEDVNALMSFAASVYQHGSSVMLALDMEMRRGNGGERGVIDLVQHLLEEYVAQGRGFAEDGMPGILSQVAGHDMSAFFAAHIDGLAPLDANAHLDVIGYALRAGKLVELEDPSPEQLHAREDFFAPGR